MSIRNSTGRASFNVNVVFANGLLIVKQYSSLEGFSFRNKLTVKFWGFDLQTAAKCPTFAHFQPVFSFAILHLLASWVELPQRRQHLLEAKSYLSCVTFSLAIPACILSGCIAIDCVLASSIAWTFSTRFSSVRLGSCSNQYKQLDEHLSMNWSRISLFRLTNSHVDAVLRSLVKKVSNDSLVPCIAWRKTCLSNTTFFLG